MDGTSPHFHPKIADVDSDVGQVPLQVSIHLHSLTCSVLVLTVSLSLYSMLFQCASVQGSAWLGRARLGRLGLVGLGLGGLGLAGLGLAGLGFPALLLHSRSQTRPSTEGPGFVES